VAFIPRALWPDKPRAGAANDFFAVAYGITTEEGVKTATFGVSLLGEGYINFGILGVVFIMALQGAVLVLLQHIFGGERSGAGGQAIFLAFFIFFLNGVGTSAEIFFGNIVQNLLCSCVLLWWVREKPSVRRRLALIESTREIAPRELA
jgi:oligosaccharide repeat unit polymerase